jgi:hypothetical protein
MLRVREIGTVEGAEHGTSDFAEHVEQAEPPRDAFHTLPHHKCEGDCWVEMRSCQEHRPSETHKQADRDEEAALHASQDVVGEVCGAYRQEIPVGEGHRAGDLEDGDLEGGGVVFHPGHESLCGGRVGTREKRRVFGYGYGGDVEGYSGCIIGELTDAIKNYYIGFKCRQIER